MLQNKTKNTNFTVWFSGYAILMLKIFQNSARFSNFGNNSPELVVDLTALRKFQSNIKPSLRKKATEKKTKEERNR